MLAEILTIGDELVRGEIVDTNAAWLAGELWQREIEAAWQVTVRDRTEDIVAALAQAATRADVVVCSGGLGPTEDDRTVDAIAGLLGVAPVEHAPSRARLDAFLARSGRGAVANTYRQVRIPTGARALDNPAGLAPGFEVTIGGVPAFALPGVPRELEAIFRAHVAPRLAELRAARGDRRRIARRVWRCFGAGESQIAAALDGLLPPDDPCASLHYNVSFPETLVKLVVRDADEVVAAARLADLGAELARRLGELAYGGGDDDLAAALGRALVAAGKTVATAESCTGGLVGERITSVPGASRYYLGGAVCYADAEKVRALGVVPATLAAHGAVSEEVACEMASGVRRALGADLGLAATGVAGPDGGTPDKPVGTVWLAVAGPAEDACVTKRLGWPGTRTQIRQLAAAWVLTLARRAVAG